MDEQHRCDWCVGDDLYESYHDAEWGVPQTNPQVLFERLILEGMQAGLSWITILRKRERMQAQFFNFDIQRLARADEENIQAWLQDAGLIRHQGKLKAMVSNAQLTVAHEDFSTWLWQFAPTKVRHYKNLAQVPSETSESVAMSKALKKVGYKFVGPTICYAFMQSVGMVNDHIQSCWRFEPCEHLRKAVV